jgi:hypothetical protein
MKRRRQPAGTLSEESSECWSWHAWSPAIPRSDHRRVVGGLALRNVDQLYEQVRLLAAAGISLIIIEWFAHDALGVANRVVVMQRGRVIRDDRPSRWRRMSRACTSLPRRGDDHGGLRRDVIGAHRKEFTAEIEKLRPESPAALGTAWSRI